MPGEGFLGLSQIEASFKPVCECKCFIHTCTGTRQLKQPSESTTDAGLGWRRAVVCGMGELTCRKMTQLIYDKGKKKQLAKHQSLANNQKVFNTDNYLGDY